MNRVHPNPNRSQILSNDWARWPMKKSWISQIIPLGALCVSLFVFQSSPRSASAQCEEEHPDRPLLSSVEFQEIEELRGPGELMLNEEVLSMDTPPPLP